MTRNTEIKITVEELDAIISKKIGQTLTEIELRDSKEHKQIIKRYFWYLKNDLLEKNKH